MENKETKTCCKDCGLPGMNKVFHACDPEGIEKRELSSSRDRENDSQETKELRCCELCYRKYPSGMELCKNCHCPCHSKEEIKIVPSPRIDYCGACDAEHGYDCPKDFPLHSEDWEKPVRELISRYNAEILNKFQDKYLFERGPGCEQILFPVLEKATADFINPPEDGYVRKFNLEDFIKSLLEKERWVMSCKGCAEGHPSFWKTIVESQEWKEWYKEQQKNPQFDIDESQELGALGEKHRDAFFNFIRKEERERTVGEIKERMNLSECELPGEGKSSRANFYHLSESDFKDLLSSKLK